MEYLVKYRWYRQQLLDEATAREARRSPGGKADMGANIVFAVPDDLPSVLKLLAECDLPEAKLGEHVNTVILTAKDGGRIIACAALEVYGSDALLRSVAVAPELRGKGLGDRITEAALDEATRLRLENVYLLTEGADAFFQRHGFERTERSTAPTAVARSVEYACACPESAVAMVKRLDTGVGA
jgi:amino-acid N-acetyltransferase